MQSTDAYAPHDIIAAVAIAVIAFALLLGPAGWITVEVVGIIALSVGIAVDLTAHGWNH